MSRISGELSTKHFYEFYKEKYKDKVKYKVDNKLFAKILNLYNKKLAKRILSGEAITLPYRLSVLRIKKCKMNYNNVKYDYHTYNTTGMKVPHLNEHSKDYYVRWYWRKSTCIVKGKRFYSFRPSRENARALAKIIKSDKHAINKFNE